jgi:septation ring formation regulator EzrA
MANDRYESEVKMEQLEKLVSQMRKDIINLVMTQEQQATQIQLLQESYNNLTQKVYQYRKGRADRFRWL